MQRTLDGLAASISRRLIAWICSRVDDSRREWALALSSELASIDGGWRKLGWAVGGLPIAWSFSRWGEFGRESHSGSAQMNGPVPATPRSSFDSFVLNIVTLVAWWMLLGAGIRTVFPHGFPSDPSGLFVGETTILIACVLGTFGALAIRRNGAAYVLAGFVAYGAVELCFHWQFGGRTVQGGPAHFADLAAGILAVTFSVLVERRAVNAAQTPVWNARAIGDSAFRAGVAIRKSAGYGTHAALGLAAFAVSEVSIRVVYGWISYLSGYGWRVRHLFLDSETNYAILACALLGAVLGAAIGKWGDHLTIRMTRRSESFEAG
jgi:hypothetical protein